MSAARPSIGKRLVVAFFAVTLLLSACDSAEERAEAHFQAGMAHLEKGDVERALLEFKNVFKLNGKHKQARLTFARLERERGNIRIAYSQYLRLVEQYPENLEGQRSLAEMALEAGNWDEVRRHGIAAAALAPDDIGIKSLNNTLAYAEAIKSHDDAAVDVTVHMAREMIEAHPELMTPRQVVIDHLVRNQDWANVLDQATAAQIIAPKQEKLYGIRLRALQELNAQDDIEKLLRQMAQVFPDDETPEQLLVQHYINRGNLDAAEQILRAKVDPQSEEYLPIQRLIAFLGEYRDAETAIAELDAIIAQNSPNTPKLRTIRARMKFGTGDTQTALAEMQEILKSSERTWQTLEGEVEYARMLFHTGKPENARALIESVLAEDDTQVDAIKFKASWLIAEDKTGDAIALLRTALGQAPRDPQLMTLMALAHERNGDRELMGEMLALATEMSRKAPKETLRYARFLIIEDDPEIAERVLIGSFRQDPGQSEILFLLGEIYLSMQDWHHVETVRQLISGLDDPKAQHLANELKAQMLAAQGRIDDLTAFLNDLARDPKFGLPAEIALVRTMLARGQVAAALARLDHLLAQDPNSLPIRLIKAHALDREEQYGEAEQLYRAILENHPGTTRAWISLYVLLNKINEPEQARNLLAKAMATLPGNPDVLMLQATAHERDGDLDQAIAVYETLYPLSNRSLIVANNLASLLTTHRTDNESLQRAHILARRLRGTRVPVFQDTYGWVAYRMGNYEEAVAYLEPAARAIPDHPLVLYHLGKAYDAAGRRADALQAYQAALATDVPLNVTPSLETEIERLDTADTPVQ